MAAAVALLGHLVAALGLPTPAASLSSVAFPCQGRPCGCFSAEECWAGDCCCFTLEQKLAWAEQRGVEPPEHVRPLVEARKARPSRREPCCCEQAEGEAECPSCTAPRATPAAQWVVGALARKCHGQGPAGAIELPPSTPPARVAFRLPPAPVAGLVVRRQYSPSSVPRFPPTPPPR